MPLLLVGMDNPQSSDPRYALFPHPPGCTGHRLWQIMKEVNPDISVSIYGNIVKTNLFQVGAYDEKMAEKAGDVLRFQIYTAGWNAVLLGNRVTDAVAPGVRLKYPAAKWSSFGIGKVAWLPHPSGRNHFYNDLANRRMVGEFLVKEMRK